MLIEDISVFCSSVAVLLVFYLLIWETSALQLCISNVPRDNIKENILFIYIMLVIGSVRLIWIYPVIL